MTRNRISLEHFDRIQMKKPSDVIIEQIRDLIRTGILNPGDMLPSERSLSERLKISRGYVREAIRKLEYYGILVTIPQKGTFVSSLCMQTLEGLLAEVLNQDRDNVVSLMETRAILEIQTARLAAERRSVTDIAVLKTLLDESEMRLIHGDCPVESNIRFHLKISELSGNPVLISLLNILIPDIIRSAWQKFAKEEKQQMQYLREHRAVFSAVRQGDPGEAARTMTAHMSAVSSAEQNRKAAGSFPSLPEQYSKYITRFGGNGVPLSHPLPA